MSFYHQIFFKWLKLAAKDLQKQKTDEKTKAKQILHVKANVIGVTFMGIPPLLKILLHLLSWPPTSIAPG